MKSGSAVCNDDDAVIVTRALSQHYRSCWSDTQYGWLADRPATFATLLWLVISASHNPLTVGC